jgi:hypothetical protein
VWNNHQHKPCKRSRLFNMAYGSHVILYCRYVTIKQQNGCLLAEWHRGWLFPAFTLFISLILLSVYLGDTKNAYAHRTQHCPATAGWITNWHACSLSRYKYSGMWHGVAGRVAARRIAVPSSTRSSKMAKETSENCSWHYTNFIIVCNLFFFRVNF